MPQASLTGIDKDIYLSHASRHCSVGSSEHRIAMLVNAHKTERVSTPHRPYYAAGEAPQGSQPAMRPPSNRADILHCC